MYVYSKLANGVSFVEYEKGSKELEVNLPKRIIAIDGGAGVTNKITRLVPYFVMTQIDDEDYNYLKTNELYKSFVASGMMFSSSKRLDDNKVIEMLSISDDGCAQYTEDSLSNRPNSADFKIETGVVS